MAGSEAAAARHIAKGAVLLLCTSCCVCLCVFC